MPEYFRNSPFVTIDKPFVLNYAGFGEQQAVITNEIAEQQNIIVYEISPSEQRYQSNSVTEITQGNRNAAEFDDIITPNSNNGIIISEISEQLRTNLHWLINYSYSCKDHSAMANINDEVKDIAQEAAY